MPKRLRNALILIHRYVGIPMSVVFVVWFASGIVMMYTGGMPALSRAEQLAAASPLDLGAVRVPPAEALDAAGFAPSAMRLTTVLERPAYRLEARGGGTTVFADTGELLGEIGAGQARAIAGRFTGIDVERIRVVDTLYGPDQWTLTLAGSLPLIKLAADDAAATEIYVSPYEAEVALVTNRLDRALAWAGAIPHWFYVTPLRVNQPLWYWSVAVAAIVGSALTLIGLVLGVTQLRPARPFRLRASIPYTGWMHWHHLLGLVFGLFALTWAFSGLLSLEPFGWTRMDGARLGPASLAPARLDAEPFDLDAAALGRATEQLELRALELLVIHGQPYYLAHGTVADDTVLLDAVTLEPRTRPFSTEAILARLERAVPDYRIVDHGLLEEYDAYYYARAGGAPLPVLRVKLDDPAHTWAYVDPARSRLLAAYNRRERVERWLYYGLHSLDFAFWYDRRPLWDAGLILLSLGGLATSGLGLYLGYRRIRRFTLRTLAPRRA